MLAAEIKTKPETKSSPDPAQAFSHPDTLLSRSLSPPLISGLHWSNETDNMPNMVAKQPSCCARDWQNPLTRLCQPIEDMQTGAGTGPEPWPLQLHAHYLFLGFPVSTHAHMHETKSTHLHAASISKKLFWLANRVTEKEQRQKYLSLTFLEHK